MIDPVAVAMDIGGTGIKCALADPAGEIRHTAWFPTGAERGPDAVVATILETASELVATAKTQGMEPVAVGLIAPGVIDEANGVAVFSANLGFRDVPLRDLVASHTGLPTALGHDVRAAALAEARLGAGRSTRRMLFVAIGTGIAAGYAVDGVVDPGGHGASGEIGHIVVRTGSDARTCGCGARGCLETYASASAIARSYGADGASDVAKRVNEGDETATRVWQEAVEALADGLLTGIALWDPRLIVLGGGLARAGDTLLEPLRAALERRRTFHQLPEVDVAELGNEAGCQGAALLALDLIEAEGHEAG
jgi:glucokinase